MKCLTHSALKLQNYWYKRLLQYKLLFLLFLFFAACTNKISAFSIVVNDAALDTVPVLYDLARRPPETEALVVREEIPFIYVFAPAIDIKTEDTVFTIRYSVNPALEQNKAGLILFNKDLPVYATPLSTVRHSTVPVIEHITALSAGTHITSFQVEADWLHIQEVSFSRMKSADTLFYQRDGVLQIPPQWFLETEENGDFIVLPASPEQKGALPGMQLLRLQYNALPLDGEDREILMGVKPQEKELEHYAIKVRKGENTLYVPYDIVPHRIQLSPEFVNSFTLGLQPYPAMPQPIPADIGTIPTYSRSLWRNDGFEVFSWSLYSNILILLSDTLDRQADFFKRLAFFVEKSGFRGKILSKMELRGKHGWNAHNYRAADLADFFNNADAAILTSEELQLRDILLANGIIALKDNVYIGAKGGILAIAADVSLSVRKKLLVHEALHGIYYEEEIYRKAVGRVWNDMLTEEERTFWRFMLNVLSYDSQDEYLCINEFQAYLLQQKTESLQSYFSNVLLPRLKRYSGRDQYIDSFFETYRDSLYAQAIHLQGVLEHLRNLEAGVFSSIQFRS